MSRILVAWELGAGGGHLEMLLPVVEGLAADGHELSVAARDLAGASRAFDAGRYRLLPAPYWAGRSRLPPAVCYAETLLRVGYQDAAVLEALLRGWLGLFELGGFDAVVAEHAPTALLAARLAGLPALALGTGFTLPPRQSPMPPMDVLPRPAPGRLRNAEEAVCRAASQALRRLGGEPLETLCALFEGGPNLLCTHEELDHYAARDAARYLGALVRTRPAPAPRWPRGAGEPVFAYMHPGYEHFPGLLRQLQALGRPALVVAPGLGSETLSRLQAANVMVTAEAVDLAEVAARGAAVITHGGHGIVATLLGLGIAPVLAPAYVEQSVLAVRLHRAGLAVLAGPEAKSFDYARALAAAGGARARAREFASRHPLAEAPRRASAVAAEVAAWAAEAGAGAAT